MDAWHTLFHQSANFAELGVKVKKALPKHLLEETGALQDAAFGVEEPED